jgi:hypothetical protein
MVELILVGRCGESERSERLMRYERFEGYRKGTGRTESVSFV